MNFFRIVDWKNLITQLVAAYEKEKKHPVQCAAKLAEYAKKVIMGDFFSEADIARHDSQKIAKAIASL